MDTRRRWQHRPQRATLCGPVVVWRRREEPLTPGWRSLHPLALTWESAAGGATPALAERVGRPAADHTPRQGLEMVPHAQGVPWSCATLRQLLGSLRAGMAAHRQAAQNEQGVAGSATPARRQAGGKRSSRWGVPASLCRGAPGIGKRGRRPPARSWIAAARGGRRVPRPDARVRADDLDAPLTALLHAIWRPGESQRRRLGSGSEDGAHPSDDSHSVLNTLPAPPRPGWQRTWSRMVDDSPACLYIPQLAEALLGAAPKGRAWAPQLRQPRQPTSDGSIRV